MSKNIAPGNASYGLREYSQPEFFTAFHEVGLTSVEIGCGRLEEELRDAGRWSGCTAMRPGGAYVSRRSIS
ncbi:MAG: hypothetical protein OXH73_07950 [Caldilineaceae bacterium]|nr:hypothetical protein [Caldilineaceae bacterium]